MTDLEPGGPYSPERTAEVARVAAAAARFLNHATLDPSGHALRWPADMDAVLVSLASMAQRMPQLCGQLAGWLTAETAAGRTAVTYGTYKDRPGLAAEVAAAGLDVAAARFGEAAKALHAAQQVTAAISGATDGSEGEGRADG